MGGTFPNTSECDIPANYGQHGLDLGKANDEGAKWALFNPNNTVYQVPTEIAKVIGGAPTGGATALAPSGGWDAGDLSILFERHHTPTSRTATRYIPPATGAPKPKDSSSDGPDKKTIIGAAVGGGVGGLLLIAAVVLGCCLCLRRRRRKIEANSTPAPGPQEPHLQPIDNFDAPPPMSAHQDTFRSQRSTQYALSPQGSPPPPSDHTWSQYGFSTPVQTTSPTLYDKDGQFSPYHGRSPSHQSMNNSSLRSSAMGYYDQPSSPPQELPNIASPPPTQEMPNVRSPLGFNADQHSQVMQSPGVDPYFAQHPPRG